LVVLITLPCAGLWAVGVSGAAARRELVSLASALLFNRAVPPLMWNGRAFLDAELLRRLSKLLESVLLIPSMLAMLSRLLPFPLAAWD
jgi:hypothetical protein